MGANSPPQVLKSNEKSRFLKWYHGLTAGGDWGLDPGDFDPQFVRDTLRRLHPFYGPDSYFGLESSGWENVPDEPVMVVSNHSGGAAAPDAWGFLVAWYRHFHGIRPIHSLAHEMVLSIGATGNPFSRLGVLRADFQLALDVFGRWQRDIFVMPGGEVDVFRPYSERYQVQFAGRKGYARLALEAGVPVVPVANAGAHETLMVLTDGRKLAGRLRLHELLRINVFPIHISFPWILSVGPWPHIPPPTLLRYKVGAPIYPPRLAPGTKPSKALIRDFDSQVQMAVQALLHDLQQEAPPASKHLRSFCRSRLSRAKGAVRRVQNRVQNRLLSN